MLHCRAVALPLCLALLLPIPARAGAPQSAFDRIVTVFQLAIVTRKPIPFHLARSFCAHTTELDHPKSEISRKKMMLGCLRELAQKVTIDKPKDMNLFLY